MRILIISIFIIIGLQLTAQVGGGPINNDFWHLKGNSGLTVPGNFIGTTDNVPVAFHANGTEHMRLTAQGQLGLGTTNPTAGLEVVSNGSYLAPGGNRNVWLLNTNTDGISGIFSRNNSLNQANLIQYGSASTIPIIQNFNINPANGAFIGSNTMTTGAKTMYGDIGAGAVGIGQNNKVFICMRNSRVWFTDNGSDASLVGLTNYAPTQQFEFTHAFYLNPTNIGNGANSLLRLSSRSAAQNVALDFGASPSGAWIQARGDKTNYAVAGNLLLNANGLGNVGVGTTAPNATLDIEGSEACKYRIISTTTALTATDNVVYVNNGATNITIVIPAGDRRMYRISRIDNTSTGTITVQLAGGTIQAVGGTVGATTSISTLSNQRSETFQVTGTIARRLVNN